MFNSGPFLQFLEHLTGIDGLIPDPYFSGGGLHETDRGGRLGVHTDFNLYAKLNLIRRINVLVFLNKDWNPEYGGDPTLMGREYDEVRPVYRATVQQVRRIRHQ